MKIIITGTQSTNNIADLTRFAEETSLEYVTRERRSLSGLMREYNAQGIVVIGKEGPILHTNQGELFFHPSMAKCRLAGYRKKQQLDLLIQASDIKVQDSILDCTLGMGADAIVASYFSQGGRVTGLESEPVLAALIRWGMKSYHSKMDWLDQAIHNIEVININHREFLNGLPDDAYDIVYFDPMFVRPLLHSQPISVLRPLANYQRLDLEVVEQACRVARKRVVLKTLAEDTELERLGFAPIAGSKHNPITYGVIITDPINRPTIKPLREH